MSIKTYIKRVLATVLVSLLVFQLGSLIFTNYVHAVDYPKLVDKSLYITSAEPGDTASYTVKFRFPSSTNLGSIRLRLCADPYVLDPCSLTPSGNLSSAILTSQSGTSGFSIASSSNDEIILSRTPSSTGTSQMTFSFDGITNPLEVYDVFYLQIFTYASNDASGSAVYMSSVANAITNPILINAKVPPILYFCTALTVDDWCDSVNGNFIDYGDLDPQNGHVATSQFGVATNAVGGYVVTVNGHTMTSGNKKIEALSTPDMFQSGVPQFGLNLRANTSPAIGQDVVGAGIGLVATDYDQPDMFKFSDGDLVAYATTASLFNTYTISYILNLPADQPSGVYNTTLAYICTASF